MRSVIRLTLLLAVSCGVAGTARAQLSSRVYATGLSSPVAFVQDPTDRACSSSSSRTAASASSAAARAAGRLPRPVGGRSSAAANRACSAWRFAPDYAATAAASSSTSPTRSGDTRRRAFPPRHGRSARRRSGVALRSALGRPDGRRSSRSRSRTTTAATSRSGPTATSTSASATAVGGDDPGQRAQNPRTLLGKMLRIDVDVADAHPHGYRVPPDNPFVAAARRRRGREIWAFGLRNPWRYSFDDPRARRHRRAGHRRRRPGRLGGNRLRAGRPRRPQLRLAQPRRRARQRRRRAPPAYLPLVDPILRVRPRGRRSRSPAATSIAARALGVGFSGRYFFADFVQGRVWSLALTVDPPTGEATASGLREHTAGSARLRLGSVSSFGVDADGELYVVSYSLGGFSRSPAQAGASRHTGRRRPLNATTPYRVRAIEWRRE